MTTTTFRGAFDAERSNRVDRATARRSRKPALVVAGAALGRLANSLSALRTTFLVILGFALITAAAFTVNLTVGLVVAGLSVLVVEYLSGAAP